MPYRRYARRSFRRRPRRRRSTSIWNRKFSLGQVARKVKYLSSMINSETHYYDYDANATVDTSGTVASNFTASIAKGDARTDRTGDSLLSKDFLLRGTITPAEAQVSTFLRYIIFIDTEQKASTPAVTDVLSTATVDSPLNMANARRFKILRDRVATMGVNGVQAVRINEFINFKGKGLHVKYDSSGARENQIYVLFISNGTSTSGTGSSEGRPVVDWYGRFKFYDN